MEEHGEGTTESEKTAGKQRASYFSRFKQSWKKTAEWNKAIVMLTAVIAGSNVVYTVYASKQWQIANQTLTEIRKGSTDTHDLAVAAGKQADAAETLAVQAKTQTDKMTESLRKTDNLIAATNKLAEQARRSADIAQRVFAITNRPYLGIDHFSKERSDTSNTMVFQVFVKNFGTVPAEHTDIHLSATLNNQALPHNVVDPAYGTLFPGIPVMRWGRVSGKNLDGIKAGTIILRLKLWASYYGPPDNSKYTYCEQVRYWPDTETWASLGTCDPPAGPDQ